MSLRTRAQDREVTMSRRKARHHKRAERPLDVDRIMADLRREANREAGR